MKSLGMAGLVLLILPGQGEELKPGLLGEYYEIGEQFDDFPSLDTRTPVLRRVDREVNVPRSMKPWPGTGLADFFCIRWTGVVRIPKDGRYAFFTASDDGSRLFVGGKLVVNNGGLHGFEEESGEVQLKAGDHALRVEYFECGGEAACTVAWDAGSGRKEILPASVLFHRKDKGVDR